MRGFSRLLKKDLESLKSIALMQGIAIVFWHAFFYTRLRGGPLALQMGPAVVPFALVFLWLIMQAVQVYRYEWQLGGIYHTLSLPQPGWKIALSKLTAVMAGFAVNLVVSTLGFLAVVRAAGGFELIRAYLESFGQVILVGEYLRAVVIFLSVYGLVGLHMTVIIQAGYNCMRLGTGLRFLLGISFFTLTWLQSLCGALGYRLFGWLPELVVKVPVWNAASLDLVGPGAVRTALVFVNSGIAVGQILGLALIFWLTGYLVQNVLEA